MLCQTIKENSECVFMTRRGCNFNGGSCHPIIDKCEGCERIVEAGKVKYCQTYVAPEAKWKLTICNFATHVKPEIATAQTKVNPLKASKRAMGKK